MNHSLRWSSHQKGCVCVFEWKYGRLNAAKCVVKLFTGNNDELQRMMAVECGKSWDEPNLSRWNEKKYSGKSFLFNAFPSGELYYIIWFTAHSFGIRVPLVMIRMARGKDRGFPSNVFVCDFFYPSFRTGFGNRTFLYSTSVVRLKSHKNQCARPCVCVCSLLMCQHVCVSVWKYPCGYTELTSNTVISIGTQ